MESLLKIIHNLSRLLRGFAADIDDNNKTQMKFEMLMMSLLSSLIKHTQNSSSVRRFIVRHGVDDRRAYANKKIDESLNAHARIDCFN